MLIKIIKTYRDIVAVCDTNLLGKKFEEGKFQLDLKGTFYEGDEKTHNETIEIMKNMSREDATFNIVGQESVQCAIKAGIISEEGIKKIAGIPFALILL
jgi:hypothetical protein